LRINLMIAF